MGLYDKPEQEMPVVNAPLPKPQLLVTQGVDSWWAHCAVCECLPQGHFPDGSIRWTGGVIYGRPQGDLNEYAYACRCDSGRHLHEVQGWAYFDEMKNVMGATWVTQPVSIVGRGDKRPPKLKREREERLVAAFGRQIRRYLAGDLDMKQLEQNVEWLLDKVAPDRTPAPTLDDILFTPELWGKYFPKTPYPDRLNPMAAHRYAERKSLPNP
jgi:hypothetical protein